jgi:MoxR-like ATPase
MPPTRPTTRTGKGTEPVTPIAKIQAASGIVGRESELALALAVLSAGRHLLLEGPVGVGKTTLALAVCAHLEKPTVRVDGDDRYSESKLTGWFDPPLVLASGFSEASFFPGPLVSAMRAGAVLFINELNRMPESVQNVLLPALDEGLVTLPHIGAVSAAPGFQVVATQNPVEYVATGHLSEALRDRFEHLVLSYQTAAEEEAIVARETGSEDAGLIRTAVGLARATRTHPAFRKGASVRAAVACVLLTERLGGGEAALRTAAAAALATRVDLRDDIDADFDAALELLFDAVVRRGEDPDAGAAAAAEAAREQAKKA